MKLFTLIFGVMLVFVTPMLSQRVENFSPEKAAFIVELSEYVQASKKKDLIEVHQEFETLFQSGLYTEEETGLIINICNLMLGERMMASPYFRDYLKGLTLIKKEMNGEKQFREWHQVLGQIIQNSQDRILMRYKEFLSFTLRFLEHKALKYSESSTAWYPISEDYEWKFEDSEPIVAFDKIDLMARNLKDSTYIYETTGAFYPIEDLWKGQGGKVYWDEYDDVDAYVVLKDYELDVKKSLYEAEQATLHYPLYFGNRGIPGKFEDKLIKTNTQLGGTYPRFESYDYLFQIDNFGKGIQYLGGFRLTGPLVYGPGSSNQLSQIKIFNDQNELVFKGQSKSFTIRREEIILGEQVESVFYFENDSLFHPSVNIRYNIPDRSLLLSRGNRGSDRNPFYSSIHGVNIDVESINAFVDRDTVLFGRKSISLAKNTDVFFESLEYYNELDYRRIQNIANVNPIAIMKLTAEQEGTNFLDANLIAQRINPNFTVDNIHSLIYDLTSKGFVNYDRENQVIEIKEKVWHYADASQEKVDYDLLKIRSKTEEANAVLNLRNLNIEINGVASLEFSPRQRVGLVPDSALIKLKPNRNLDFAGRVFAGFSTLEGKDFHFDYEKFHIQMDSVRYFDLYVPTGELDQNNRPVSLSIGSRIENLNGVLLIDAPSNKSGKDDIKMFPSFQSKSNAYVFYDGDSTLSSSYGRDSFYFELKPFSFNHLDAFGTRDIAFKGVMKSADIFPEFEETLTLQDVDQSLGFLTKTPDDGYPNYLGKGNYKGEISLSNKGLQGNGTLQYLDASVDSDDIIFKPKQLLASAKNFDLEEKIEGDLEVPMVRGFDVKIDWRPYKDSMYVTSDNAPFELFKENNHTLEGTLILTPGGLKGNGELNWDKASMTSKLFSFGSFSAFADTCDIRIKIFDTEELALKTSNVTGDVDFKKQVGYFKANKEDVKTDLPFNKYQTSLNEFDWDMDGQMIVFKDLKDKTGTFLSLNEDHDSLTFLGEYASYNIQSKELVVDEVPFIVAGDAFIYPDSGQVIIEPGGRMTTLENARIIADTLNRYHVINRARVNVRGRNYYEASGFYEYNIGDKEQEVEFSDIASVRTGKGKINERPVITTAKGQVTPEDNFYIDYKTEFQGTITLSADSKNLLFDGFARLDADRLPNRYWFSIHSRGDKKDLAIEFDVPKSIDGAPLQTGLYLSKETAQIYPSVMMPLKLRKDREIISAKGVFQYDELSDQFIFGDSSKVILNEDVGNLLIFKNSSGDVEAEGRFNLGSGMSQYVQIQAAGTAKTTFSEPPAPPSDLILLPEDSTNTIDPLAMPQFDEDPLTAQLMTGINMFIPEQFIKVMSNDFRESSFDAQNIVYLTDLNFYRKAATTLFPKNKEMQEVINALGTGFLDIPKKYNAFTFLFSQLKLKWEPNYQSFISTSNKSGLISINGEGIGKIVNSFVEIKMPSTGDDRIYLYFKSSNELYYYFEFKQGILGMVSNNSRFMDEFEKMKAKDLIIKMDDGEPMEIQPLEPQRANLFLRRIQTANN